MKPEATPAVVDLAREPGFTIGPIEVRPSTREVIVDGRSQVLEPRIMQVLTVLARRRGEVVSRDELIATCWAGRTVGEDAITRCIGAVRRLSESAGGYTLETVPRVGYRIKEIAVPVAPAEPGPAVKPSIAVMPFANLTGDPDQEYFADGMVVEITGALSRVRAIMVIASGSSLSFKGGAVSAQEAARQMGVRYLLEGSVRKSVDRVRITVQLIDSADGAQIWTDRFDDTLDDIFALQDRVALAVAGVIEPRVQHAEMNRVITRSTDHMTSYDLYLRSLALYRTSRQDSLREAMTLLDRAIEHDPGFGLALGLAGLCRRDVVLGGGSSDPDADRALATDLARRAVRAAGDDAEVLAFAGATLGALDEDIAAVISLFDRAIALNPGSSTAWLSSGMMRLRAGEPAVAAEHIEMSMRLDPVSPLRGRQVFGLGAAWFDLARYGEAADLLKQSITLLPQPGARVLLAASHALSGRLDEASRIAESLGAEIDEDLRATLNPLQRRLCEETLAGLKR